MADNPPDAHCLFFFMFGGALASMSTAGVFQVLVLVFSSVDFYFYSLQTILFLRMLCGLTFFLQT